MVVSSTTDEALGEEVGAAPVVLGGGNATAVEGQVKKGHVSSEEAGDICQIGDSMKVKDEEEAQKAEPEAVSAPTDEDADNTRPTNETMEEDNIVEQEDNFADNASLNPTTVTDLNEAAVDLAAADDDADDTRGDDPPAASSNDNGHDDTLENVSDISASSSEEEAIADDWMAPTSPAKSGDGERMDNFGGVTDTSSSQLIPRNRSMTISSVITNTSEHGSIRSQRENVDRLLMSGTMSGAGSIGSRRPSASSLAGSDRSPHQRGLERPYFNPYDRNYYKSGDWLRFVPRRSTASGSADGSCGFRGSSLGSDPPSLASNFSANNVYMNGESAGFGNTTGNNMSPDQYYRGFDNRRIRTGFYRYPGAAGNPTSRVRSEHGSQSSHHPHHHDHYQGESGNILGPNGELLGPPTPSTADANISLEHNLGRAGGFVHHPHMYPNLISAPIDEEEGGEEKGYAEPDEHLSRKEFTSPPLEIHCAPNEDVEVCGGDMLGHQFSAQDEQQNQAVFSGIPSQGLIMQGASNPTLDRSSRSPLPPETGMQFESSLRVGGIIRPPPSSSYTHSHTTHTYPIPPHLQEQKMHEASWDSKYEMYACRVDQTQEDRSVEIPIFSFARPHMRSFHFAWLTFFFAFLAWFAITPLLGEVQKTLGLTKEQIWTSNIASVSGAVVTRCVAGLFCDIYGARWMSALVLLVCGVPTIFTGAVNTAAGLSVLRLVTGIGGSAFVTCQYWTTTMFTKEVAGTANALAAGWGNLGGGVAQIFVGSMLFPFFKWIYRMAGTEKDPAELSWRTCCIIPGLVCTVFTIFVIRYADDSPKGNHHKRKHLGLMQKQSAMKHIKAAIHDHNTWLLLVQYGCCFGVELTTSNAAALYFQEEFELSTEAAAAVASTFGWMNLFARGLGGFLSDISNAYQGMRGRLRWQLLCFLLEGVFVMVFSKAKTLGGAITALMTFSLFVQGAEGSTFGIVPYLNPNVTGTVAGLVGAGGNAGAVIFSILFRQMEYRDAFFWMGATTSVVSVLSSFVWIRGYEGLFFQRRVIPILEKKASNINPPNTSEQAADEDAQNHSRTYIETDPHA